MTDPEEIKKNRRYLTKLWKLRNPEKNREQTRRANQKYRETEHGKAAIQRYRGELRERRKRAKEALDDS